MSPAQRDHLPSFLVKVGHPVLHQPPPAFEQVGPRVRRLDPVLRHVRERRLDHLVRVIRPLRRPVPEARPEAVGQGGDALLPD